MRIEELIAKKIEARLDGILDRVLDNVLEKAVEGALARILGVDPEPAPTTAPKAKRTRKAKATEPAPTDPAPKAEAEPASPTAEDKLLARLEDAASRLGEKYGPMLMRRAKSIARHAINPHGALATLVAWAEATEPTEVIDTLRGSEKLPDGTLSGWRLMAHKLAIPVQE